MQNADATDAAKAESTVKIHEGRTDYGMGDLQPAECVRCGQPSNPGQGVPFWDDCDLRPAECLKCGNPEQERYLLMTTSNQLLLENSGVGVAL